MIANTHEETKDRRLRRLQFAIVAAIVYVAAGLLLAFPGLFFALGVQAFGAAAGWWQGDPNSNDGEGVWATAIGVVAFTLVLTIAALILWRTGRRYKLRSFPAVLIGTAGILLALTCFCIWTITTAPASALRT